MKLAGMLLLLAGWLLALCAVVLLPRPGLRAVFLLAALGVEGLGLGLAFRSHALYQESD